MTQDTSLSSRLPTARDGDQALCEQFESAQAWWREAGVDCDFHDAPTSWITAEQAREQPRSEEASSAPIRDEAAAPGLAGIREKWPAKIEDFIPWWLAEPLLTAGGGEPGLRVVPRGPAQADLMVLVAEPEADDRETLLSGPHGRFLANILAATGVPEQRVYFASILPRHTPLADWEEMARHGFGDLALRHVQLVAPRRLLAFGRTVSSLLGNDPAQNASFQLDINHGGAEISALACWDLAALLMRAKARSGLWQRWLDWTVSDA